MVGICKIISNKILIDRIFMENSKENQDEEKKEDPQS